MAYRDSSKSVSKGHQTATTLSKSSTDVQVLATDLLQYHHSVISGFERSLSLLKRKLDQGRTTEVMEQLRSRSLVSDHVSDFSKVFDRIVLRLWPDFVDRINGLLHPLRKLEVADEKSLPAELRVIAFTVLGIENASVISTLLGLSPNTIYTYRNRSRSRAIKRESFDEDLRLRFET